MEAFIHNNIRRVSSLRDSLRRALVGTGGLQGFFGYIIPEAGGGSALSYSSNSCASRLPRHRIERQITASGAPPTAEECLVG